MKHVMKKTQDSWHGSPFQVENHTEKELRHKVPWFLEDK
jgi:hypothetical protein